MLTEKEAWLKIRESFEKYSRTGEYTSLSYTGVCNGVALLNTMKYISDKLELIMRKRIWKYKPKHIHNRSYYYYWTCSRNNASKRVKLIDKILAKL